MLSNVLTKSLGVPQTNLLNNKKLKKKNKDGLYKIFKDFEERMETGFTLD